MFSKIYSTFKIELSFIKEALVSLKNHASADLKVNGVWYAFIFAILFIFLRELVLDTIAYNDYFTSFTHLYNKSFNKMGFKNWFILDDQRFMFYLWAWFVNSVKLPLGVIVFIFIFFAYINSILLLYIIELLGKIQLNLFIKLSFIILYFLIIMSFLKGDYFLGYLGCSAYLSISNLWMFLFLLFCYITLTSFYSNNINYVSSLIVGITGSCIVGSYSAGLFHIFYLLLFAFLYEYFYINKKHNIKELITRIIKYLIILILILMFLRLINAYILGSFDVGSPDYRKLNHLSFKDIIRFCLRALRQVISEKYIVALIPLFILAVCKITTNNIWRGVLLVILFLSIYIVFIPELLLKQTGATIRLYAVFIYISYIMLVCLILYRHSKIYLYLGILVTVLNLCFFNKFIKNIEEVQKLNKTNTYTIENINREYKALCPTMDCQLLLLADVTLLENQNNFYLPTWWVLDVDNNLIIKGMTGNPHHYRYMSDMKDKKLKAIWEEKSKLGIRYPMEGSIIKAVNDNGKTVIIVFV